MSNSPKRRRIRRRSPVILIGILLIWSLILGWGFSQAMESPPVSNAPAEIGTVDAVTGNLKLAQDAYLQNCATCHIGIPPAIFPTQTWRDLLQDSQHYGATLTPLVDPTRSLVWRYLRTFSRQVVEGERIPYRVNESKAFKILHPKVELPKPLNLSTCITCHPGTNQYNFRKLSADWENAP
ncbi:MULTISPECIES: diheme cytochrome C [unclassified Leptolyngbya]|uniref:diheme cytochrome C n=1 Tax=unclassified Leptolyngbya TaxID=2650499 RepID=UPI001AC46E64|nr:MULTISPECIES: diheme cytochrome C [unclassified Leptolyngbya]MBN8559338.1 diheme cytochrome C [Leptolyngbya sp. UWPOB_LEPTO1]MCY6489332.1 diheme cytochrome C [Leptolyngbya sp. GGD]